VGFSFDPADLTTISGFLRDARGRLSAINRPGAISTAPFGINNRGQIVAWPKPRVRRQAVNLRDTHRWAGWPDHRPALTEHNSQVAGLEPPEAVA
jgi:hypothetical protein